MCAKSAVIEAHCDVDNIYAVPEAYHAAGLDVRGAGRSASTRKARRTYELEERDQRAVRNPEGR
jgi:CTP synthase